MTRRPRPQTPVAGGGLLDWSDSSHWHRDRAPCRYCGGLTNLRDSKHKAAHKCCAEQALAQQAADTAASYENGTF